MIDICTCMQYHPREALAIWRLRASPVIARLMRHGHRVDMGRMQVTLDLVCKLEQDHPACSSPENRHRSHHLPGCPIAPRSRGRVARSGGEQPVQPISRARAEEWINGLQQFLMQRVR